MSGYIDVAIEIEPIDVADEAFAYLEDKVPGWLPSPGNLEAWLVEALSLSASELRELTGLVPDEIFAYFGESLLGLPRYAAVSATGTTTWTAVDTAGYTVIAGTLIGVSPPADPDVYAFEVVDDFTIAAGTTSAAAITVRALEPGAQASGITGTVQMLDPLDFISTVTLNVPTSGGTDAETMADYLDRLSTLLTLLAPRPILPQDFAILAQQSFPQVGRATAIDMYNADTATSNVERCVTVVVTDENGEVLSSTDKADIDAFLEARREVNFLVFVADPTYSTIDVTFACTVFPGFIAADVQAQVIANLTGWLSPANWGKPPFGDPGTQGWINETVVRYLEVIEQVQRTDGVNYVTSLTLRKAGGTMGTADVPLTGVAPLPRPGAITGSAVPTP